MASSDTQQRIIDFKADADRLEEDRPVVALELRNHVRALQRARDTITVGNVQLDEVCQGCHGDGGIISYKKRPPTVSTCPFCGGIGVTPTHEGHLLLSFLERHQP